MTELDQLAKSTKRMFTLVCFNFVMLLVLFCGIGYVIWQSAALIGNLQRDLDRAEAAVAELKAKLSEADVDVALERVVANATANLKHSVASAMAGTEVAGSLQSVSAKLETAQSKLETTSESVRKIGEKLQGLETEHLAQLISYHMLKGLGEGFERAAETRKPAGVD